LTPEDVAAIRAKRKKKKKKKKKRKRKKKKKKKKKKKEPFVYPDWLKTDHKMYWKHKDLGVADDIEGRSDYAHYKPTQDEREKAMERYWRKKQNKKLAEKREAEEHIRYMISYSQAKSRIKEETGRKCEAMSFGTNFG
jgi:hypothetical protein